MLNDTYQTVKDNFIDYQSLKSDQRRSKRSLLPIIGQAMSMLFGTVSDVHLENSRTVEDLALNQEIIIHNLEQSMTILNLSRIEITENRPAMCKALDDKTRQSAQWGTYTPEERYRQFLTSTKYVALTLEMVGWMNSMLIAISPKPLCRRIIKFNKRS